MVSVWSSISNISSNEYLYFAIIILVGFGLARAFLYFLETIVVRIARKTMTDLDDIILRIVTMPLYVFVLLGTTHYASRSLTIMAPRIVMLDRIYCVLYIIGAAFLASKILEVLISRWLRTHKKFEKTPILVNKLVAIVIYVLAFLLILNSFQINITPLIATLGIGGLAVGLALQSTLANFFAGLSIISDKPIDAGQFVQIGGIAGADGPISGYVEDISWRSTRIKTLTNTIIIIPNSKLAESTIINYSLPEPEMGVPVQCRVGYDSDLKKVEKITLDIAKKIQQTIPGAVRNFEPGMRYNSFGDSNILFTVGLRAYTIADKYAITHEFIKALKEKYDKEGIEISYPVRKIYKGYSKTRLRAKPGQRK